jgi:hypothetical protein
MQMPVDVRRKAKYWPTYGDSRVCRSHIFAEPTFGKVLVPTSVHHAMRFRTSAL